MGQQDSKPCAGVTNNTPLEKIQANIKAAPPEKRKAVLLTTGSLNPVHISHVQMMHEAKRELEQNGIHVVGGFMSPSHDDHVRCKFRHENLRGWIPGKQRVNMLEIVTADSPWLAVDTWEIAQPGFRNFDAVAFRLQEHLDAHFGEGALWVVYVCGGDLGVRSGLLIAGLDPCGVVVVERSGYDIFNKDKWGSGYDEGELPEGVFCVATDSQQQKDCSSTAVRTLLAAGRDPQELRELRGELEIPVSTEQKLLGMLDDEVLNHIVTTEDVWKAMTLEYEDDKYYDDMP
eukprot:TRINITY_DN77928_c0_g1_i1.p1 TRINITY_DN77928_c0_g1~~TRINITY_DN77928_c0_g1_i1.p1  ORF type:complete len:288 (+),score=59.86 TRINITY_DN77928_c0_g1_i1:48-911(+)